jgi:hypothetical protein
LLGFLSSSAGSLAIAGTLGLVVFVGAWRAEDLLAWTWGRGPHFSALYYYF